MNESNRTEPDNYLTDEWGSVEEAQGILKCSRSTLYRWIRSGLVPPPRKVGPNKVLHNLTTLRHRVASCPVVSYAPQSGKAA